MPATVMALLKGVTEVIPCVDPTGTWFLRSLLELVEQKEQRYAQDRVG